MHTILNIKDTETKYNFCKHYKSRKKCFKIIEHSNYRCSKRILHYINLIQLIYIQFFFFYLAEVMSGFNLWSLNFHSLVTLQSLKTQHYIQYQIPKSQFPSLKLISIVQRVNPTDTYICFFFFLQ